MQELEELIKKLNSLPKGYLSCKIINRKRHHYLQRKELGKVVSTYIKECDVPFYKDLLKEREDVLKILNDYTNKGELMKETLSKGDSELTGYIMMGDQEVATIVKDKVIDVDSKKAPHNIKLGGSIKGFLSKRCLDESRNNSRLLKKALNVSESELLPLYVYGATITDNYWFKPKRCNLHYKDIRFKEDTYYDLSLKGDNSFTPNKPRKSPQLTLVGSFEKGWKLIDKTWWLYKVGNENELFSEMFVSRLASKLDIPSAYYELDGAYIRTRNFADKYNFEPISYLVGDNQDFNHVFSCLNKINKEIAKQYLLLMWFDALVYNYDRHNENYGLLRNKNTGKIVSLAPNFDNNNALISRTNTLLEDRSQDGMINSFVKFLETNKIAYNAFKEITLPDVNKQIITSVLGEISIKKDDANITNFIINGFKELNYKLIY